MNFALERLTAPDIEPVTLAEAKVHLRMDNDDDTFDDLIESILIPGGREWVEDETGQVMVDHQWRLSIGSSIVMPPDLNTVTPIYYGPYYWHGNRIYLRRTPIISIVSFVSVADDGTETAVDADSYELRDARSKWPFLFSTVGWHYGNYRITFRAGYVNRTGSPTQSVTLVPARLRQSVLLHVEAHFDRDEKMMNLLLDAARDNVSRLVVHIPFA